MWTQVWTRQRPGMAGVGPVHGVTSMLTYSGKYLSPDYQNVSLLLSKNEVSIKNFCVDKEQRKNMLLQRQMF